MTERIELTDFHVLFLNWDLKWLDLEVSMPVWLSLLSLFVQEKKKQLLIALKEKEEKEKERREQLEMQKQREIEERKRCVE